MSDLPIDPHLAIPAASRTPHDFDAIYEGTPPWDIGRPQPAFAALADEGALRGRVLDVGCGTGEHALMAADLGLHASGIDISPRAIALATTKACDRGLDARFFVWDALELERTGERFDTILDSGLFHVFDDERRPVFVHNLAATLEVGGHYYMLCFSDRQPGDWGPRRVHADEIRDSFRAGWEVEGIDAATLDVTIDPQGVHAWVARIARVRDEQ